MATAPVIGLSDFGCQFVVATGTSDVALGTMLDQDFGSGMQPIAYGSRKLNATESHCLPYESEMLRIMWVPGQ